MKFFNISNDGDEIKTQKKEHIRKTESQYRSSRKSDKTKN